MSEITRETVVEALKAAAVNCNGPLSLSSFIQATGITKYRIFSLFPDGGWLEVQNLAGVERNPGYK